MYYANRQLKTATFTLIPFTTLLTFLPIDDAGWEVFFYVLL